MNHAEFVQYIAEGLYHIDDISDGDIENYISHYDFPNDDEKKAFIEDVKYNISRKNEDDYFI